MERRGAGWPRIAVGVLLLGGCSDSCGTETQPGVVGELGNGRFHYACTSPSDPACEASGTIADADYFPTCIALGGRFELDYELLDASALESDELTPVLYIDSVNQRFFEGTSPFRALRVGRAAFVVRESERVLDLLHLDIVEPDAMDIVAREPASPTAAIELPAGDTEVLRVFPRSSTCTQLGGGVTIEAESSDPLVATVAAGDELRIQGQANGTAVVTVRLGALEQTIAVTVVDGPIDPDTSPIGESTSSGPGSDDGTTDPDTGTATDDPSTSDPGTGSTGDPGTGTTDTSGASTGTTTMGGT